MSTIKVDTIATRTGSGNITLSNSLASATIVGDLTVDTSTLKVDATNNRVGIGTTSPNKVLHLETSGETVQRMVASTTNVAGFYFGDSGNGSIGQLIYDNSNDSMRFNTNGVERIRITSGGNVGVQTNSPNKSSSSTALTVNTSSAANYSALELSSGDTLNWHINANNAAVYDVTAGTRPRVFYTNGSERLRILSSGGITFNGDTAAANALDDYEEGSGSFTSITDSSNNAIATNINIFRYTKIGRFVQLEIRVQLAAATTVEVRLNGLPFTISGFDTELGVVISRNVFAASSNQIRLRTGTNNQYMYGIVTYYTS